MTNIKKLGTIRPITDLDAVKNATSCRQYFLCRFTYNTVGETAGAASVQYVQSHTLLVVDG